MFLFCFYISQIGCCYFTLLYSLYFSHQVAQMSLTKISFITKYSSISALWYHERQWVIHSSNNYLPLTAKVMLSSLLVCVSVTEKCVNRFLWNFHGMSDFVHGHWAFEDRLGHCYQIFRFALFMQENLFENVICKMLHFGLASMC